MITFFFFLILFFNFPSQAIFYRMQRFSLNNAEQAACHSHSQCVVTSHNFIYWAENRLILFHPLYQGFWKKTPFNLWDLQTGILVNRTLKLVVHISLPYLSSPNFPCFKDLLCLSTILWGLNHSQVLNTGEGRNRLRWTDSLCNAFLTKHFVFPVSKKTPTNTL